MRNANTKELTCVDDTPVPLGKTLRRCVADVPRDYLPALLGELEMAKALAWSRLTMPSPSPTLVADTGLLKPKAMADQIKVQESWLREKARQGRIPYVPVGRYMRFDPEAVLRALKNA